MSRLLRDLDLAFVATKRVVVLTDAFPPFAVGGAEVSLISNLMQLSSAQKSDTLVLSFAPSIVSAMHQKVSGLDVIFLPEFAGWPHEATFKFELDQKVRAPDYKPKMFGRLVKIKRLFSSRHPMRVLRAYREARARPKGGIVADHLMSRADVRLRHVLGVLSKVNAIDTLLCDNTKSILVGHAAAAGLQIPPKRRVAVVRDNRFFCSRPNQSMLVRDRHCSTCDFACVEEDIDSPWRALRKTNLALTRSARIGALAGFENILVTSHTLKRQIASIASDSANIIRIPNPVGEVPEAALSDSASAKEAEKRLLIIGMLNENKGQLRFLKSVLPWLQSNPDVKIALAGRGQRIASKIVEFMDANNLSERVELLGYLERAGLYSEIAKAEMVVCPTVWPEPFGRVPLEAGALGKPVVAFAVGGLNETIVSGHTGFLVAPRDYQALTEKIDTLLQDRDLLDMLGQNAATFVRRKFSVERTAAAFNRLVFAE